MKATNARATAYDILKRVDEGAYADLALDASLKNHPCLAARDRSLVTELVYGVLRTRGRLDFALRQLSRQPLEKLEPAVLRLLRLGTYQILQLDRIPAPAAVHETVELTRTLDLERATGLINGILRSLIRRQSSLPWPCPETDPKGHLCHVLSVPGWIAKRWLKELGREEAMQLAEAMLCPAPFTLRVNTLRIDRETFLEKLKALGHEARPCRYAPDGVTLLLRADAPLPGGQEGLFQVQDEASMLIGHLVAPRPGERVLDTCAAPGGKTTHMAALAENQARITALELHPHRVELIKNGATRLGCEGISALCADSSAPLPETASGEFDRVLVDAPCSGLGVLRRNPESRWSRTASDLADLAHRQSAILNQAAPRVRPGGRLVYSLCTQTPEETRGVIEAFLSAHPEFIREDIRSELPEHWLPLFDSSGALCTRPHRHDQMDAFYAVVFTRQP